MPSTQRKAVLPRDAPTTKRSDTATSAEASTSAERGHCCDTSERSDETVPDLLNALNRPGADADRRSSGEYSAPSPILSSADFAGNANADDLAVATLPGEDTITSIANVVEHTHEMIAEVAETSNRNTQELYTRFAAESERVAERMETLDSNVARMMRQEKADRAQGDMIGQRRMRNMERKFDQKCEELCAHFEDLLCEQREYYEGRSREYPRALGSGRGSIGGDARRRTSSSSGLKEMEGNIRSGRRSIGSLPIYDSNVIEEDQVYGFQREEQSTCTDTSENTKKRSLIERIATKPIDIASAVVNAPIKLTKKTVQVGVSAAESVARTSMDVVDYFPMGTYATWAVNKVLDIDRQKGHEVPDQADLDAARSPTPEPDVLDQRN